MTSVYLDANVYIYYFDRDPNFGKRAENLVKVLADSKYTLTYSSLCLGEVLVRPIRERDEFTAARVARFFRSGGLMFLPFLPEAAVCYAELRAVHRISAPDALHLSTASASGVDLFITNDTRLLKLTVPGIGKIVNLDYAF